MNLRANDILIYLNEQDEPTPIPFDENGWNGEGFNVVDKYYLDEGIGGESNLEYHLLVYNEGMPETTLDFVNDTIGEFHIDINTGELSFIKMPGFFGKYRLEYIVENTNPDLVDRIDTAYVNVYVGNEEVDDDNSFLIPNAFSPNGDGINDFYVISGREGGLTSEKSKLEVFNRWGALVYRSKGIVYGDGDEWWDGTSTTANMVSIGSDLPNGTYFYVFTVEVNTGEIVTKKEYSGYIELRR